MKGTETGPMGRPRCEAAGSHGGVPLVKGTETQFAVGVKAPKKEPRRCPPREGD